MLAVCFSFVFEGIAHQARRYYVSKETQGRDKHEVQSILRACVGNNQHLHDSRRWHIHSLMIIERKNELIEQH